MSVFAPISGERDDPGPEEDMAAPPSTPSWQPGAATDCARERRHAADPRSRPGCIALEHVAEVSGPRHAWMVGNHPIVRRHISIRPSGVAAGMAPLRAGRDRASAGHRRGESGWWAGQEDDRAHSAATPSLPACANCRCRAIKHKAVNSPGPPPAIPPDCRGKVRRGYDDQSRHEEHRRC